MGFKIRDNETMINYLKSIKTSIDISRQLSSENGRSKEYLSRGVERAEPIRHIIIETYLSL